MREQPTRAVLELGTTRIRQLPGIEPRLHRGHLAIGEVTEHFEVMAGVHRQAEVRARHEDTGQGAKLVAAKQGLDLGVLWHETHLVVDGQERAGAAAGRDHLVGLGKRTRHRLFAEDVANTVRHRREHAGGVRRRGGRDHQCLRPHTAQHLLGVGEAHGGVEAPARGGRGERIVGNIGQTANRHAEVLGGLQVPRTHAAESDDGDAQACGPGRSSGNHGGVLVVEKDPTGSRAVGGPRPRSATRRSARVAARSTARRTIASPPTL